jgi:glycosyltransferase involved in cell wall biosynthesis
MILPVKLAVCIVTYNQENFIEQCILSALKQKTTFSYEIIIGNDNSTDNTLNICLKYQEKYPEIIKVINNIINLGLVPNTINILKIIQASGINYIAMLDGDDFWIDEYKLQKQVDFLENNREYGLIHTQTDILDGTKYIHQKKIKPDGNVFNQIAKYPVSNCTAVFRTSLLKYVNWDEILRQGFLSFDYILSVIFAYHTKFKFLQESTAVWRRGHTSVSNTNDYYKDIKYIEHHVNVWRYLSQIFPVEIKFTELAGKEYLFKQSLKLAFKYKNYKAANRLTHEEVIRNNKTLKNKIMIIAAKHTFLFKLFTFLLIVKKQFNI